MVRRRWKAILLVLLGIGLIGWWAWPSARVLPGVSRTPAGTGGRRPTPIPGRPFRGAPDEAACTEVAFYVVDEAGVPLDGVRLRLHAHPGGVTDARGQLVLACVPPGNGAGEPHVEGSWSVVAGSTSGPIQGATQQRRLVLRPACPGGVRVRDEAGRGVSGVQVSWRAEGTGLAEDRPRSAVVTDAEGLSPLEDRPCGTVTFALRDDQGWFFQVAEVTGDGLVDLVLPAWREGILAVVDDRGHPMDAWVLPDSRGAAVRTGVGRFRVRARRSTLTVTLAAEGYPAQQVRMPLDGGEHEVTLVPGHVVEVSILCGERCPDALRCGAQPCSETGPAAFRCDCPAQETWLFDPDGGKLELVGAEDDAVVLDLREATLMGRWTGPLPCVVWVDGAPKANCEAGGHFVAEGLRPGPATLTVRHGPEAAGARGVVLPGGETTDVGEVGPDAIVVDGIIEADFPLGAVDLTTRPLARVEWSGDGSFLLHDLPPDTTWVDLSLHSTTHGRFRERLPVRAGQHLPIWRVGASAALDTTPLAGPDAEDTGSP